MYLNTFSSIQLIFLLNFDFMSKYFEYIVYCTYLPILFKYVNIENDF